MLTNIVPGCPCLELIYQIWHHNRIRWPIWGSLATSHSLSLVLCRSFSLSCREVVTVEDFFLALCSSAPTALGGSIAVQLVQLGHCLRLNWVEPMVARANKIMHFGPDKHARAKVFDLQ